MSNITNDIFWETFVEKHWAEYEAECRAEGVRATLRDFLVWAEEHDLIPEPTDYEGGYGD